MKRVLSLLLTAVLLACAVLPAVAAQTDAVSRISCSMYRDGKTGRGFCWFTQENGRSDLQLIEAADFTCSFVGAEQYSGTSKTYLDRW